jgi:hypothetical protein
MMEVMLMMFGMVGSIMVVISAVVLILILRHKSSTNDSPGPTTTKTTKTTDGSWIDTNITSFNDPTGFAGVDLFKHGKAGIKFDGKTVYPCAVHHDDAAEYLWSVIDVESDSMNPIRCHVVDICNRNDDPCVNKNKNGLDFLVDVHETGWNALGKTPGIEIGRCKKIGELGPSDLPIDVFLKGKDTYVMCRCTGECKQDSHQWKPVTECKR